MNITFNGNRRARQIGLFLLVIAVTANLPEALAYRIGDVDLKLRGNIDNMYDDNITYVHTAQKRDLSTELTGGIAARYEGKRITIDVTGNVGHQFYYTYNSFDNTSEDLAATLTGELSRFDTITLKDTFTHQYEPRSFEDAFGRTSGRYSSYRNILDFQYQREISKQLSGILRYTNTIDTYSLSTTADSNQNRIGGVLQYALSSKLLILGTYDFYRRTYDPGGHTTTNAALGGVRYFITNQLSLDANAGLNFIEATDGTSYTKPVFSATLNGDINESTKANLGFVQQYSSSSYSSSIFNYWQVSAGIDKQVTSRLKLSGSGFYGHGEYVVVNTKDDLWGARASLAYELTQRLRAEIGYTFSDTLSNVSTREYLKNTFTFGLKAEF